MFPLEVVQDWLRASNRQDIERLLALSDPNIELVGPRGSGFGQQLLLDWLRRAGLTLQTRRTFARGDAVVMAQHGVWRSPDTGTVGEADVASRFRVSGGLVVQFARHDDITVALREAALLHPAILKTPKEGDA